MQLVLTLFAVFFCLASSQMEDDRSQYKPNVPRICTREEFEKIFTGNATKVYSGLRDLFNQNAEVRILNKTVTQDEMRNVLEKADFKSFVSIVEKPILVREKMCYIDLLAFATMKNSDCIIGGRRVIHLHLMNEKISKWHEVFFPLNFSYLCTSSDYEKLPQDLFGSKREGRISSEKIELPHRQSGVRETQSNVTKTMNDTANALQGQNQTQQQQQQQQQPQNQTQPAQNQTQPAQNQSQPAQNQTQPVVNKTIVQKPA